MTLRSAAVPAPAPPSAVIRSRTCQSLADSSRDRAASRAGLASRRSRAPFLLWPTGAALSMTVQAMARPRSVASSSIRRPCCGQSMCEAVVTCQKPRPDAVGDGRDRVLVGVAVDPGDHARAGHQDLAELGGQDPAVGAGRPPVVDQRLQRVVAEQHHRAAARHVQLGPQPGQLGRVERALPPAVRVDGVQRDAPDGSGVEHVVGGAQVGVAAGEAVARRGAGGPEVLADVVGPAHRRAAGIGGDPQPRAVLEGQQGIALGSLEPGHQVGGVHAGRRRDELDRAGREVVQPALGRNGALEHVVVVAVHGVPGQAEARGPERAPGGGQRPGRRREAERRLGQVLDRVRDASSARRARPGRPRPRSAPGRPSRARPRRRPAGRCRTAARCAGSCRWHRR